MEIYRNFIGSLLYENDILSIIPELFLLNVILILLVFGVYYDSYVISLGDGVIVMLSGLSLLGLLFTIILFVNQMDFLGLFYNFKVIKEGFNNIVILIVLMSGFGCLVISSDYIKHDRLLNYEYILLYLLGIFGIIILVSSNDLLVLYLAIELQSLCFYIMAGFKQNSDFSTEAGLKYFVLGAFSSGIFLFGISLFYGLTGLLNFTDISYLLMNLETGLLVTKGIIFSVLCMIIGLLFKIGAVPFHMWLPDVYEGSDILITGFFAIVPKIGVVMVLVRLIFDIFDAISLEWNVVFVYSAILSLVVGSFGAVYQKSVKRLIAYSGISHVGFILLGFIANNIEGIYGIYLYMIIYILIMLNIFGVLFVLKKRTDNKNILLLGSLNTLYYSNKWLGISLCLVLFSIAGVPPLAGFYAKLYVFFSVMKQGEFVIAIISILLSVVGTVYYLRLIKIIMNNFKGKRDFLVNVGVGVGYVISYTTLLGLWYSVYSTLLIYSVKNVIINSFW